jgi:predicted MFS family arabinose efflux permease
LAVTIVASGNYVAGTIWPPLISAGMGTIGWRHTHLGIALVCVSLMTILVLVLRAQMGDDKVRNHANAPPPRVDLKLSTNTLTVLLSIASISCCVAMAMPQVHIVAYCGDLGYGPARGAEMLSLMLGFGIFSRLATGFVADRIGGVPTLLMGSTLQGVALLLYFFFDGLTSLYVISALFGLFQGGIVPSYAIIVREYFPSREAGTRIGLVVMATLFGMALGGWMSGAIFDYSGSYRAAFANGIGWNLLNVTIATWLLLRTGRRGRMAFA